MLQLANEILGLTSSTSRLIFNALPSDDPITREPDISKATSILGWEPKVNRNEGLTRTIEYFKNELENL